MPADPAPIPSTIPPDAPPPEGGRASRVVQKSNVRLVCEAVVDLVAIVGLVVLAAAGKIGPELVTIAVLALAGVRVHDVLKGPPGGGAGGITGGTLAVLGAIGGAVSSLLSRLGGGHHVALLLAATLGAGVGALSGCPSTAVQRQTVLANASARAFNAALPVVVAEQEHAGQAAIRGACCQRPAMEAALAAHERAWSPVVAAWELAKVAHDAWRLELEACRRAPDGGACGPGLDRSAAFFVVTLTNARCAVRAVGRADLDPIPGALTCPGADGGR